MICTGTSTVAHDAGVGGQHYHSGYRGVELYFRYAEVYAMYYDELQTGCSNCTEQVQVQYCHGEVGGCPQPLCIRALRNSSIAANRHGMPSECDCPMDATNWASRYRKKCGDSARDESSSGVPGARGVYRTVIPEVPGCTGGSSTEVVLNNLELVECVWVSVGEN
ncbi:hypothetical protein EVAR_81989_1 [Eumeta japonica]|uniref:Uncharacterized protein n=1 Tax=Eumeta variegata TaxID=151549 RepID=A0A4C1VWE7_EUMVA|nr:hypothetical protein EVAR_81989_1 [Eumeta japonica]